jgi:hypothetical protein
MVSRKLVEVKKKESYIMNTIKKLKKESRIEPDKSKKKKIKREIKKLENSLPGLRRHIYENSKDPISDMKEQRQREEIEKKQAEAERARLIQRDLENRKAGVSFSIPSNDLSDKSRLVCPSCGASYNNSSGFNRCKCS